MQTHVKHQSLVGVSQHIPVQVNSAITQMSGDKNTRLGVIPVGQGYPGIGGTPGGGSNTRYHLKMNTLLHQCFDFFPPSAKYKWIASFQA